MIPELLFSTVLKMSSAISYDPLIYFNRAGERVNGKDYFNKTLMGCSQDFYSYLGYEVAKEVCWCFSMHSHLSTDLRPLQMAKI